MTEKVVYKPSYYSIIPAEVRYDPNLKPNEKLLYAEITSLSGKEGYCYACNDYFAKLYGTSKETVSRWISSLEKFHYLKREIIRDETGQVTQRRLYIKTLYGLPRGIDENVNRGIDEKVKDNNKYINNIYSLFEKWNSKENLIKHKKLTDEMEKYCLKALQSNSEEEISIAIDRLDDAVGDKEYYYNYRWNFGNFFKQRNGLENWLDEGQQYHNYLNSKENRPPLKNDNSKDKDIKQRREL